MAKLRPSDGFTLIELMLIVAIIGVLAVIAVPKISTLLVLSREGRAKGSIAAVRSALTIYFSDNEGLMPSGTTAGAGLVTALTSNGKYMAHSLGRFEIPRNSEGNPGHDSAQFQDLVDDTAVLYGETADESGGEVIVYSSATGRVFVNCLHNDLRLRHWSTY